MYRAVSSKRFKSLCQIPHTNKKCLQILQIGRAASLLKSVYVNDRFILVNSRAQYTINTRLTLKRFGRNSSTLRKKLGCIRKYLFTFCITTRVWSTKLGSPLFSLWESSGHQSKSRLTLKEGKPPTTWLPQVHLTQIFGLLFRGI